MFDHVLKFMNKRNERFGSSSRGITKLEKYLK